MNRQVQEPGIRKWAGDDLIALQAEPLKVLDSFFARYGNAVVSGCEVFANENGQTYNISSGVVCLSGIDHEGKESFRVVPFAGVEEVTFPVYLTLEYETHQRLYADNHSKPVSHDYRAVASSVKPENKPFIEIDQTGPKYFIDAKSLAANIEQLRDKAKKLLAKHGGVVDGSLLFAHDGTTPTAGLFSETPGLLELCKTESDGAKEMPLMTVNTTTQTIGFPGNVTMSRRFSGNLNTLATEGIYYANVADVSAGMPEGFNESEAVSIVVTRVSSADGGLVNQVITGLNRSCFRQINKTLGGEGVAWHIFNLGDGIADGLKVIDTRSRNEPPDYYRGSNGRMVTAEFKHSSSIGLSSIGLSSIFSSFTSQIMTFSPWIDNTGGKVFQIAFSGNTNDMAVRCGSGSSWEDWTLLVKKDKCWDWRAATVNNDRGTIDWCCRNGILFFRGSITLTGKVSATLLTLDGFDGSLMKYDGIIPIVADNTGNIAYIYAYLTAGRNYFTLNLNSLSGAEVTTFFIPL